MMKSITKKLVMTGIAATAACYLPAAMANYQSESDSSSDRSHPGAFVKDSVITTKVKSKLAAKHMSTLTNIKVDTDNHGVVVLSGKAPTKDASDLAEMIAKDTEGVTSVRNKIIVAE
ncbi:MAG TPA: BON domain-containing protein [Steroidobacteraceae bacterium]|nr:BON domain-containing protein [Steroidobacteraceae bacterium]